MAGAQQYAAVAGDQRKHMAGPGEIVGAGVRIGQRPAAGGALVRRNPGAAVGLVVDRHRERGGVVGFIGRHHRIEPQPARVFARDRRADDARGVADDERHLLGGAQRGRDNQIALALAVVVIGDDHEFAAGEGLQDVLDRVGHCLKISLVPGALAGLARPRELHYAGQNGSGGAARQASRTPLGCAPTRTRETPFMSQATFGFAPLLPAGLPAPAAKWTGLAKYSFVGGNNDPDQVPVEGLIDALDAVLRREGRTLATYGLASGPQGYRPLREFLTAKLERDAGIQCAADDILIVSGSLQALDLVNATLLTRGDTVIIERDSYQGALNRLTRLGVNTVGIPLDQDGMRIDALAEALDDLKRRGITPKYIYTIPTVQNPTGTIMPPVRRTELLKLAEQYGVPIFEDDCYADLIWDGKRPPAIHAMATNRNVIHIGSLSKSIAPAVG